MCKSDLNTETCICQKRRIKETYWLSRSICCSSGIALSYLRRDTYVKRVPPKRQQRPKYVNRDLQKRPTCVKVTCNKRLVYAKRDLQKRPAVSLDQFAAARLAFFGFEVWRISQKNIDICIYTLICIHTYNIHICIYMYIYVYMYMYM